MWCMCLLDLADQVRICYFTKKSNANKQISFLFDIYYSTIINTQYRCPFGQLLRFAFAVNSAHFTLHLKNIMNIFKLLMLDCCETFLLPCCTLHNLVEAVKSWAIIELDVGLH